MYPVGSYVTLKKDLVLNQRYGGRRCSETVYSWRGTSRKVIKHRWDYYILDKSPGWFVTEEMLVNRTKMYKRYR